MSDTIVNIVESLTKSDNRLAIFIAGMASAFTLLSRKIIFGKEMVNLMVENERLKTENEHLLKELKERDEANKA